MSDARNITLEVAKQVLGGEKHLERVRNLYENYERPVWRTPSGNIISQFTDFEEDISDVFDHVIPALREKGFGVMLTMERHSWVASVYRRHDMEKTRAFSVEDDYAARAISLAALQAVAGEEGK